MYVKRPKIRTNGIYISRVVYFKQGQVNMDNLATYHKIVFFRYIRFYPDFSVCSINTTKKPREFIRLVDKNNKEARLGEWARTLDSLIVHLIAKDEVFTYKFKMQSSSPFLQDMLKLLSIETRSRSNTEFCKLSINNDAWPKYFKFISISYIIFIFRRIIMKLWIFVALLSLSFAESGIKENKIELKFNEVMEIIGGVFVGMGVDVSDKEIEPCVSDIGTIGDDLEGALNDFLTKTYTGKVEALALLAKAYKNLPSFILSCKPGSLEAAKTIEEMILAFKNPLSVAEHMGVNLLVNGQDILAEVSYAMEAYQFGLYFNFGFYCGQAGFKILYVPDSLSQVDNQAIQGIITGILKSTSFEIEVCPFESKASEVLYQALNQDFTFTGISDSLRMLGIGLTQVFEDFTVCSGVDLNQIFANELQALINPYSLFHKKTLIVLNGVDVSALSVVKINYMNRDWENIGFYIGRILASLSK